MDHQQQYHQPPPQQQYQQHSGGFRGGGRGGGRGRGRGGGGRGAGGRGRGGRGGGGRGRGRGGFSHSYSHHQQQNDQQQQTPFEDYGPQSHVMHHNGNGSGGGGNGYNAQPPPPVPAAPVQQQQQQQQINNQPGFLNVAAYANGGQQQQHQQAVYQPPVQYQPPQSGYGAPSVPSGGYGAQPSYLQSNPQFQQQRSYDMGVNAPPAPPLPNQPPPSEQKAESGEFMPPLPKQPAPPLPVSPALAPAAPQQPPPSYPHQTQPQSGYSEALYSRQQAYAPVNTQQQQAAPPLLPVPQQPHYHAPQVQYQPQYQQPQPQYHAQQPQYQVPPPLPPSYVQPGGYHHHPHHQPHQQQQQQQYVQPAPAYAVPPPQQYQQQPVHQPQPPLPRPQPAPPQQQFQHQQQPGSRPPPSTYCCHKCGQPGHWIQDCQSTQSNYNRGGGGVRGQRPTSHSNNSSSGYQQPAYYQQQPQPPAPYQQQQQYQRPPQQEGHQQQPPPQPPSTFQPAPPSYYTPQGPIESPDQDDTHNVQHDESMEPEQQQQRYGAPLSECPPLPDSRHQQEQQWCCENCDKSFTMESQFDAHVKTHVSCHAPDCDFSASKRVVGAHFQTAHGQFAGSGLKEIDVEGQKFMVLVGNSPEDIAQWRAERRKKWPSVVKQSDENQSAPVVENNAPVPATQQSKKRKLSNAALDNGAEDLEDGEIGEDEPKVNGQIGTEQGETSQPGQAEPSAASKRAPAADGSEPSPKRQKRVWLCKNFLRNQCRFGDECKFSHDRKDVVCRSMLQKGKCSKGDACLYSHDAVQIQEAAAKLKSKNANKSTKGEKVLEEKWKTEQGSLLRKLLKKDMRVEQHQMLQIVRTLVANQFFQGQQQQQPQSAHPVSVAQEDNGSGVTVLSSSEAH